MNLKRWTALIGALVMCFAAAAFVGCEPEDVGEKKEHTLSFLKAEGEEVKNAEGQTVTLHGTNAGGYGVTELWMCALASGEGDEGEPGAEISIKDYRTISQVLIARFGEEQTRALWHNYGYYWWNETDFKNCADMGINVIRLPFTYMNLDFSAVMGYEHAGENLDFTFLDNFVDMAEKYGMYTILDMHGAYGSQNGQDHSGEQLSREQVTFYTNEEYISLTEQLWAKIAEHFKDNPAVAGYDLLNEPGEKAAETTELHWKVFDRLYKAIRATGDEHIVIFESCWSGANLPKPTEYGWENCMYQFHHYTGDSAYESHIRSFRDRVLEVEGRNFGVPILMGEFTCYGNERSWEDTLKLMNDYGWSWTTWTYKIDTSWRSDWGIYNAIAEEREVVDVHRDSYDEINRKFKKLGTANYYRPYSFSSGRTLADLIKDFAKPAAREGANENRILS